MCMMADICQGCQTVYHFLSREVNSGWCKECYPWYVASKQAEEEEQRVTRCSDAKVNRQNVRAVQNGMKGTLTLHQWKYAVEYFHNACAYCGGSYEELEHIIPISKGGGTTHGNCIPVCHECNAAKLGKSLEQCAHIFELSTILKVQQFVAICSENAIPEQVVISKACRIRRKWRVVPVPKVAVIGGKGTRTNRYGVIIADKK